MEEARSETSHFLLISNAHAQYRSALSPSMLALSASKLSLALAGLDIPVRRGPNTTSKTGRFDREYSTKVVFLLGLTPDTLGGGVC